MPPYAGLHNLPYMSLESVQFFRFDVVKKAVHQQRLALNPQKVGGRQIGI